MGSLNRMTVILALYLQMTEMCKCVACLQLVTVMNCVNISDCDYVDSDGVTKTI